MTDRGSPPPERTLSEPTVPERALPEPREPGLAYRIALVCLGNICRSPIAEVVLRDRLERAGLDDRVQLDSAGTGDWHLGQPMDDRARAALAAGGYDGSGHRARQFGPGWFDDHDLVLVMDSTNLADVLAMLDAGPQTDRRVMMFRAFDPAADGPDLDVPDPWYGGADGFDEVLAIVERTSDELTRALGRLLR